MNILTKNPYNGGFLLIFLMYCYVYKSSKKDLLYLYVTKLDDFSEVPEALMTEFGTPIYVLELELLPERKLAQADTEKVLSSLVTKGYFLQLPPTEPFD